MFVPLFLRRFQCFTTIACFFHVRLSHLERAVARGIDVPAWIFCEENIHTFLLISAASHQFNIQSSTHRPNTLVASRVVTNMYQAVEATIVYRLDYYYHYYLTRS
ncbi:hypothetical protein BS50DRAFT_362339 [Corynespora cassiicola Philippines]|uniref:Uncharacterized protein n=1 Tax=Corynespora cassiicola Philippines TaxID=1448308 RepID=A0A2T2NSG8_CORCC|nr:hypothetical protein BS50DRAFT_362339 [Corynespora cassiicola Philippines]